MREPPARRTYRGNPPGQRAIHGIGTPLTIEATARACNARDFGWREANCCSSRVASRRSRSRSSGWEMGEPGPAELDSRGLGFNDKGLTVRAHHSAWSCSSACQGHEYPLQSEHETNNFSSQDGLKTSVPLDSYPAGTRARP